MWSEDIDRKIREGADGDIPAYDEKAWDKMLPLLDEHLPVKKKRRWLLPLFIFLLAGGVSTVLLMQNGQRRASENSMVNTRPAAGEDNTIKSDNTSTVIESATAPVDKQEGFNGIKEPTSTTIDHSSPVTTNATSPQLTGETEASAEATDTREKNLFAKKNNNTSGKRNLQGKRHVAEQTTTANTTLKSTSVAVQQPTSNSSDSRREKDRVNMSASDTVSTKTAKEVAKTDIVKQDSISTADKKQQPKAPGSRVGRFSVYASLGPDISSIGLQNTGRMKMQYGIGVGFDITKRLTVRTGLYVSRKVYTADSADYHPPKAFWSYFSNLQTIDANCLVYEIPVSVAYRFSESKKHSWFLSAGLSSYLMKKETYDYNYKDTWNQPQSYRRSYKNENKHYFSVLGISGGYQYKVTDRFSILAEPYMKLPLGGVGYGKVRLSSAGLLFTASYKPFSRK